MSENKRELVSARIHGDIAQAIRLEAVKRKMKFQDMYQLALAEWLGGKGVPVPTLSPFSADNDEGHELLEEIYTKGSSDDAGWITGNLKNFVEAIRSRKPAQQAEEAPKSKRRPKDKGRAA